MMDAKYKRMLAGMLKNEQGRSRKKRGRKPRAEEWSLYMLRCGDHSLYTGIAKDLQRRIQKHSDGKGARYTRTHLPVKLVYSEVCGSRTQAMVRECAVKALPKEKKEELIGGKNNYFSSANRKHRRKNVRTRQAKAAE